MERTFYRRDIGRSLGRLAHTARTAFTQDTLQPIIETAFTRREAIEMAALIIGPAVIDTALGNPLLQTVLGRDASPESEQENEAQIFDMWDYLTTDNPHVGLTGTHRLSQTIQPDRKRVFTVKFGDKRSFEQHEVDKDGNIRLHHDNSDPNGPYNFTNGLWMKPTMTLGESFRVHPKDNMLERFGPGCKPKSREPFGYTITLEEYYQTYDTEGPLGMRSDVIKLVYAPDGDQKEEFFYDKEIGWFQWNLKKKDGDLIASAIFSGYDRKKPVQPDERLICVWPGSETPPQK